MEGTVSISIKDFEKLRLIEESYNRENVITNNVKNQYISILKHLATPAKSSHERAEFERHKYFFESILTEKEIKECKEKIESSKNYLGMDDVAIRLRHL